MRRVIDTFSSHVLLAPLCEGDGVTLLIKILDTRDFDTESIITHVSAFTAQRSQLQVPQQTMNS